MKDVREEIRGWVNECITDVEQEGACSCIMLLHYDGRGMDNEIFSMKSGSSNKWGKIDDMAESFFRFAQRHASGHTGAQQFKLQAVYGDSGRATRFLPFGIQGVLSFGPIPGGGSTEPPTSTGSLQQGMRLTELLVQGAFAERGRVAETADRMLDRAMRRQAELELENREMWIALKTVLMELQKEKHADKMKELMAARMTEFGKHLIKLAPALINMMADREVFPLSASDTGILDTIAEFSSVEDLRQMQAVLSLKGESGQQIAVALTNRFEAYHKRKAEEAEADKRLLAGLPSRSYEEAELDAAGDAIKALRGRNGGVEAPAASVTTGAVKALMNAPEKTNGSGHRETQGAPQNEVQDVPLPRGGFNDAENFLADLFEKVPREKIEMVIGVLGMDQPELAGRMKELLVAFKS